MSNIKPYEKQPGPQRGSAGERAAALIYGGAAFLAAAAFWAVTTFAGSYPAVATFGGALWVFVLMMIVLMPVVIPRMKKWRGRGRPQPVIEPGFGEEAGEA
ncbi:MAG: hypothetical protein M1274_01615 [Actinobacteria bacterium]|nr:hypothetical protein [Actinomycetota bacterium]